MNRLSQVHSNLIHALLIAVVAVVALGCSDSAGGRRSITGSVSFDGEPLEGGWIYFRPIADGPSAAAEIQNGTFNIDAAKGLIAGEYIVSIEYHRPTGKTIKVNTGEGIEQIEQQKQIIPARYNQQSKLKAKVQPQGANELTFELKS